MWELEDDDVVVRGGIFKNAELILEAVEDAIDMGYGPVLSVFVGKVSRNGGVASSVGAACRDGEIPHNKVRVSSVQKLIAEGFGLVQDTSDGQPDCHFHVLFPAVPTILDGNRFIGCFGEPIKNPTKESAP